MERETSSITGEQFSIAILGFCYGLGFPFDSRNFRRSSAAVRKKIYETSGFQDRELYPS